MNNIKDIDDFLTEKKVTVKRRYTESHPAKNVSTSARVRTSILEAIADGQITEAEMTRILKELKAHKRWLNRNKPLFNVSEDQGGIKTFSLSPYGKRVMNATKITVINEALTVPHKEKGKKPVNIFVGRFQPFTLGHVKVFQKMYKENGYPVVVYMVRGSKPDPEKRPFDEDLQQAMFSKMQKQYPFLEASYVVPNGAIDTLYSTARPAYEPMMWGYGTDRKKAYNGMIDKQDYRDQLGVHPDFKGFEIKRGDENISASKVRNALKIDDEKTFKQMTPKSIHSFYKPLQTIMQPIKENNNMKNLKTLNEFVVNEPNINEAEAKEKPKEKPLPPPQDIDGEDMEPKMAKVLLNLAKKEYKGEFQGSYTVASGNKRMRFDAIQAILTLLKEPDSGNGNYGPLYGINVVGDKTGTIEDFENNKVGKLNTKSLSGAISSLSSAMKAAEKAHDKLGSLGWSAEDEKNESVESIINEKKAGFVAIYKVMGQEFKFGPLKTDDKKSIMAMLSSAIQGGFQLIRVIPADQVKESVNEAKRPFSVEYFDMGEWFEYQYDGGYKTEKDAIKIAKEITGNSGDKVRVLKNNKQIVFKESVNEAMSFHNILQKLVKNMSSNAYANFADEHLNDPNDANEMQEFIEDTTKAEAIQFAKEIKKGLYEGKVNEEFIEIMHNLDDGLDLIKDSWLDWKNGPVTDKSDIKPARRELLNYINSWLNKNIK